MTDKHRILFITHGLGGGVESHVTDVLQLLVSTVDIDVLRPVDRHTVRLECSDGTSFLWRCDDWDALAKALKSQAYSRIHFHHLQGYSPDLLSLPARLGLPYDVTLHDFFAYCPQFNLNTVNGTYCGEPDAAGCQACVARRPHPWGWSVTRWRAEMGDFLAAAQRIIAPTSSVLVRMKRYFPTLNVQQREHPPRAEWMVQPLPLIKVVLIGKLSPIKGLNTVRACVGAVKDAKTEKNVSTAKASISSLHFVLLGYLTQGFSTDFPIEVRGEYPEAALPDLLALERADVVWFPGQVPETHCYALDVALTSGLPIVASDCGAFVERLANRPNTVLLAADSAPETWNQALLRAAREANRANHPIEKAVQMDMNVLQLQRQKYAEFLLEPLGVTSSLARLSLQGKYGELDVKAIPQPSMSLPDLFEQGVECGKHEPRLALKHKLSEIERDFAVLEGYQVRNHKPWYVLLEEMQTALQQTAQIRSEVHWAVEEAARAKADLQVAKNNFQNSWNELELSRGALQLQQNELDQSKNALQLKQNELEQSKGALQLKQNELDQSKGALQAVQTELHALKITLQAIQTDLQSTRDTFQQQLNAQGQDLYRAVAQIRSMENSTSWVVTEPLRKAGAMAKTIRHKASRLTKLGLQGAKRFPLMIEILNKQGPRVLASRIKGKVRGQSFQPPPVQALAWEDLGTLSLQCCTADRLPRVSIVIPVYGQHRYTFNCLKSLAEFTDLSDVEIIVVDDASPEPAAEALKDVNGCKLIRNVSNLGFIGSCHYGADLARGEFLILLNNDVQVTPGWLEALLDVFRLRADAGMVGARLVYPDGRLQEAGGIVWRDGSAWNWGRGDDPERPAFRYLRAVDYCSGACLALHRSDWVNWGGFDRAYTPAYYEDTDLAFRVRQAGKRVYYQPEAKIVHFEGISSGTDETQGVKRHQVVNREVFLDRWKSTLGTHRTNGDSPVREADRAARAHVLIVEACMITPDQDSGSIRMLAMLELLVELNCKVSFVAENLECRQPYAQTLQQAGVEVWHHPYISSVSQLLEERGSLFDVIIVCRHYIAAPYLADMRRWAPQARIVFDTVDLHYLREQRQAELEHSPSGLVASGKTRDQELGVINQCDLTLVVSPVEKNLLATETPEAQVRVLSNIHEPRHTDRTYAQRAGLIFVGGFRHPPNVDAVNWFVTHVWPLVLAQLPTVTFTIVGSNMPDSIAALAGNGIVVAGFVENIHPLLDAAKISVAPLRYGAGVKGKINEAMACGLPVVATSVAAEGMNLLAGKEILVAEEPQAYADSIVQLYQDPALWAQISEGGFDNIRKHFSRAIAKEVLAGLL